MQAGSGFMIHDSVSAVVNVSYTDAPFILPSTAHGSWVHKSHGGRVGLGRSLSILCLRRQRAAISRLLVSLLLFQSSGRIGNFCDTYRLLVHTGLDRQIDRQTRVAVV